MERLNYLPQASIQGVGRELFLKNAFSKLEETIYHLTVTHRKKENSLALFTIASAVVGHPLFFVQQSWLI